MYVTHHSKTDVEYYLNECLQSTERRKMILLRCEHSDILTLSGVKDLCIFVLTQIKSMRHLQLYVCAFGSRYCDSSHVRLEWHRCDIDHVSCDDGTPLVKDMINATSSNVIVMVSIRSEFVLVRSIPKL